MSVSERRTNTGMHLFNCSDAQIEAISTFAVLESPLGRICLGADIGGLEIGYEPPSQTYRLASGGWIACWPSQDFDAELLICRPLLSLPFPMTVTDCWAG